MQSRLIAVLCLVLSFLCSFAQRVNEHGLKMVSEIEYLEKGRATYQFKFKYNDENKLTRMTVYQKWIYSDDELNRLHDMTPHDRKEHLEEYPIEPKLYRDFIKTSEGLTVKDYDFYNYSPLRWEVAFDCYDNICKISEFEEFEPGAIKREEFNIEYERDGLDNTFRLSRYSDTETSKRKGQKSWYGTTVGTLYKEFYHKDGFLIIGDGSKLGKDYTIDYNHINDTNMNLLYFIVGTGLLPNYFSITEWLPCRSKYFIDESVYWKDNDTQQYHYRYDTKGNLIEIERIFQNYLNKKISIKYLY